MCDPGKHMAMNTDHIYCVTLGRLFNFMFNFMLSFRCPTFRIRIYWYLPHRIVRLKYNHPLKGLRAMPGI